MASQWSQIFGPDPDLRAADTDREATAERLRASHAEGRLDTEELQQRLERCYAAKTLGDLKELVSDLPGERTGRESSAQPPFRHWRWRLAPFAPVLLTVLLICALTGHHHGAWLFIPLAFLVWRLCWWRWRPWRRVSRMGPDHWV
jgi:hypothetical protein